MGTHNKKRTHATETSSWIYLKVVASIVRHPFLVLDMEHRVLFVNEAFLKTFQVSSGEICGSVIYEVMDHEWDIPSLRILLEKVASRTSPFREYEIDHEFSLLGQRNLLCSACMVREGERMPIILLSIEDMTAIMSVAEAVALQMRTLVAKNAAEIRMLEIHVEELEREMGIRKGKQR